MNRPWLMRITVGLQALIAVACFAAVIVLLRVAHKPNVVGKGTEVLYGLHVGAWIVGGAAVVYAVASLGLFKRWRWTWWLSVVVNALLTAVFLYGPIMEHDWEDAEIGLIFPVLVILLFVPQVRKFILRREAAAAPTTAAAAVIR